MNDSTDAGSGAESEHPDDELLYWVEDEEQEGARWAEAPVAVFVVGALVGAFVLGLAWLATTAFDDEPAGQAGAPSAGDAVAALAQQQSGEALPAARGTRLERCTLAKGRLSTSLKAAAPAMEQWEVHVGAMNQLVVGAISVQQASDFWEQTRRAAKRKIGDFSAAVRPVHRAGLDCPVVERVGQASKNLRACAASVDAHARAVDAAETAIRTWAGHVKDMDMMRMGHLSPAKAAEMWLVSWKQGVREIEAYEGALGTARKARGC